MQNEKPKFDKSRALSWSSISLFSGCGGFPADPEKWYRRYYLNIPDKMTAELLFGNFIDKKIQNDPTFLPDLTRYPSMQHKMNVMFGKVPLIGYSDGFRKPILNIKQKAGVLDYKTGKRGKWEWTQKKADETGQLTMYGLMNYIQEKINPEDCEFSIIWFPTKGGEAQGDFSQKPITLIEPCVPIVFKTKRTMVDILKFGEFINKVFKEMEDYVERHP